MRFEKIIIAWTVVMATTSIVFAQKLDRMPGAISNKTTYKFTKSKIDFSMKTELKSEIFYFAELPSHEHRLRLKPKWEWGNFQAGIEQDIKREVLLIEGEEVKIDNTVLFFGLQKLKFNKYLSIAPTFELELPTNEEDRLEDGYLYSPALGLEIKSKMGRFELSWELSGKHKAFKEVKKKTEIQEISNEIEAKVKITKKASAAIEVELEDTLTLNGTLDEKYKWKLGFGYDVNKKASLEFGYGMEDKRIKKKSRLYKPMVLFDEDKSSLYSKMKYKF